MGRKHEICFAFHDPIFHSDLTVLVGVHRSKVQARAAEFEFTLPAKFVSDKHDGATFFGENGSILIWFEPKLKHGRIPREFFTLVGHECGHAAFYTLHELVGDKIEYGRGEETFMYLQQAYADRVLDAIYRHLETSA